MLGAGGQMERRMTSETTFAKRDVLLLFKVCISLFFMLSTYQLRQHNYKQPSHILRPLTPSLPSGFSQDFISPLSFWVMWIWQCSLVLPWEEVCFPPFLFLSLLHSRYSKKVHFTLLLPLQSITALTILSGSCVFWNSSHYLSPCVEGTKQTTGKIN